MSWEQQLQDNWAIVVGFVTGVVTWGKTVSTVSQQGKEQGRLDGRVTKIESDITAIKESAASIEAYAKSTKEVLDILLKKELG